MKPEQYDPFEGRRTPLALRKQMLILRAGLQREELAQHVRVLRGAAPQQAGWLTTALRPMTLERLGRLWSLLRQYPSWGPALGSAASWGLSRWRWPALRHVGLAFSLGWLVWQGWRLVSAHQTAGKAGKVDRQTVPMKPANRPLKEARASAQPASNVSSPGSKPRARPDAERRPSAAAATEQDLLIARRLVTLARRLDAQR
jgi:hypothetical protein